MRSFIAAAVAALAAFLFFGGVGTQGSKAQTPPPSPPPATASAPVPKPLVWLVDNKERLVTVREKDGPYLFAQVITTPRLIIQLTRPDKNKGPQVVLKDENGASLWKTNFPFVSHGDMGMEFANSEGIMLTMTPGVGASETPSGTSVERFKAEMILGADNAFVSGEYKDGANQTLMKRQGSTITLTSYENNKQTGLSTLTVSDDKKSVVAVVDGKEVVSGTFDKDKGTGVLSDTKGQVTIKIVQDRGRYWTEFTVGDRKVLAEGQNLTYELRDGQLYIYKPDAKPAPDAPPAAKP